MWQKNGSKGDLPVMIKLGTFFVLYCTCLAVRVIVNKVMPSGIGKSAENDTPRKMYKLFLKSSVCT